VIARRQLGVAIAVVGAAMAVLLVVHSAPAVDASRHGGSVHIVVVSPNQAAANPLPVRQYTVWFGANDRFGAAAHAFQKALGGCRMRLGSFGACALPAITAMAYEERDAAAVAAIYAHHPGPCGRAMHDYGVNLAYYMASAAAFAHLPHGNPMSALTSLQASMQASEAVWNQSTLRVRGECRAG
jgi:hypothetical protein